MNSTLNKLALLSFNRKARKIGKYIGVIDHMNLFFIPFCIIRAGETLFIWSEENGFHSIHTENDKELAYVVDFPEKYGYDEVYHFGVLNADKTLLSIFRCYDQLTHQNEVLPYGLQHHTEEYRKERDRELQEENGDAEIEELSDEEERERKYQETHPDPRDLYTEDDFDYDPTKS